MTNPQSEVKCPCACHQNTLKKPYEHDSKCCDDMNGTVSQSVEGWEIQYSEIADRMFREFTDEVWRQKIAPYLREIKSLQSTTLSTYNKRGYCKNCRECKNMWSRLYQKRQRRVNGWVVLSPVEHLYMRVESTKPSKETYGVVVPCAIEYHMPSKKSNRKNAGISAAVEVVKKMGV